MTVSFNAASSCAVTTSNGRIPPRLCTEQFHVAAADQNIVFIIKPLTPLGPMEDAKAILEAERKRGISCNQKGREWHVSVPRAEAEGFFDRLLGEHKMSITTLGKAGCVGFQGEEFVVCSEPREAL